MAHFILGIDEVGRGPWAGPLVMGGCILPVHDELNSHSEPTELENDNSWILDLTDSKKLSPKKREELYKIIKDKALASATGWVSVDELNKIGLAEGLRLACRRTVENVQKQGINFNEIIIDGPTNFLKNTKLERFVTNLNKADLLIKEVSAASIVAKVERDNYMYKLSATYPNYGFEKHVGYGTAAHISAIADFGVTPEHRLFIKRLREGLENGSLKFNCSGQDSVKSSAPPREDSTHPREDSAEASAQPREDSIRTPAPQLAMRNKAPAKATLKNTTKIGSRGEAAVAKFLEEDGHEVLARNFKTKFYEIDIISKKSDRIYFTEVKYRKTANRGSGFAAITKEKQNRMATAAETFMNDSNFENDFCLAVAQVSGPDFRVDDWFEL